MKFLFIIPIQSISDIITNSSSEMFVAAVPKDLNFRANEIEKILESIRVNDQKEINQIYATTKNYMQAFEECDSKGLDIGSGDGNICDIEVLTWKEISHYIRKCNRSKYDKKNGVYLKIEIDHSRKRSIDWIRNNLDVVYFEDHS